MPTPTAAPSITVRIRSVTADDRRMDADLIGAVGTALAAVLTAGTPLLVRLIDAHDEHDPLEPVAEHLELPPVPPRRKAHA